MPLIASLLLSALSPGALSPAAISRGALPREAPRVLLLQRAAPKRETKDATIDPNVPLANLLAGELDGTGKVRSIVYDRTDPIFRAAADDGVIKPPQAPTDAQATEIARKLGCRSLIVIQCIRQDAGVIATLRMTGSGRPFEVAERGDVRLGDTGDLDLATESVARTLAVRLNTGPWKELPSFGTTTMPDDPVSPGQIPTSPANDPPALPAATPLELADAPAQAERLIAEGKYRAAILLLREAVDVDPFDPLRRRALVRALRLAGMPEAALAEARAALLLVNDSELRVETARALIDAGRSEEAEAILNEALARTPEDPVLRRLVGELALRRGQLARALEHLDAALKEKPDAAGFRLRAVARGLLGGADGVGLDLDRAAELDANPDPDLTEGDAFSIVDAALVEEGPTLRLLFQKALLSRTAPDVIEGVEAQERLAAALLELTRRLGTSVKYAGPRESRVLALNLLRQCMGELRAYLSSGKEDDLADARITLGEALRNLQLAREAHAALRKPDARPS